MQRMSLSLMAFSPAVLDKRMKNAACTTLGKLARCRERRQYSFLLVFLVVESARHCGKVLSSKKEALRKDLHPVMLSGKMCPLGEEGFSAPIGAASLRGGSKWGGGPLSYADG